MTTLPQTTDILVVGDEIESCLTAVSAARALAALGQASTDESPTVTLWRPDNGLLGGLSTRAQLSYMDITPEWVAPVFGEFLTRAGVERVALERHNAQQVLQAMLNEARVQTGAGGQLQGIKQISNGWQVHGDTATVNATIVIDATPDSDVANGLGVPFTCGLGGLLGDDFPDTLGVTPVFHTTGVSAKELMAFEADLRARPETTNLIAAGLPWLTASEQAELMSRPVFCQQDYVDVLNPVIGLYFHQWCGHSPESYPTAPIKVDGFNISQLPNGVLGWNGLVATVDDVNQQLTLSKNPQANWPIGLCKALSQFQAFLRNEGGLSQAVVIPPEQLYIRQTRNVVSPNQVTATQLFQGGVSPEEAIGTFSYWIDLRGVSLHQRWPETMNLPKPTFNVGLAHCWLPDCPNVALVSRSGGYSPLAQGACRIVQHLAQVGEGVGIAAALALKNKQPFAAVPIADVRGRLQECYAMTAYRSWVKQSALPNEGQVTLPLAACKAHPAFTKEFNPV